MGAGRGEKRRRLGVKIDGLFWAEGEREERGGGPEEAAEYHQRS